MRVNCSQSSDIARGWDLSALQEKFAVSLAHWEFGREWEEEPAEAVGGSEAGAGLLAVHRRMCCLGGSFSQGPEGPASQRRRERGVGAGGDPSYGGLRVLTGLTFEKAAISAQGRSHEPPREPSLEVSWSPVSANRTEAVRVSFFTAPRIGDSRRR